MASNTGENCVFPIPMRGNEPDRWTICHDCPKFPIPMRGNESYHPDPAREVTASVFPIPMRGNESADPGRRG